MAKVAKETMPFLFFFQFHPLAAVLAASGTAARGELYSCEIFSKFTVPTWRQRWFGSSQNLDFLAKDPSFTQFHAYLINQEPFKRGYTPNQYPPDIFVFFRCQRIYVTRASWASASGPGLFASLHTTGVPALHWSSLSRCCFHRDVGEALCTQGATNLGSWEKFVSGVMTSGFIFGTNLWTVKIWNLFFLLRGDHQQKLHSNFAKDLGIGWSTTKGVGALVFFASR